MKYALAHHLQTKSASFKENLKMCVHPQNLMLGRPKVATPPSSDQTFWVDQTDPMVDGEQEKQKSARSGGDLASEAAPSGVLLQR